MWIEAISKVLTGAFVGYITNDMAIQMLFRKRLGLGGIFLKTRDEFIQNISVLVEKDIINHHTLDPELRSDAFSQSLEATIRNYFEEALVQGLGNELTLSQIPDSGTSFHALLETLLKDLPSEIQVLLKDLVQRVPITSLASAPQMERVASMLSSLLLERLDTSDWLTRFLLRIWEAYADKPLHDLFGTDFFDLLDRRLPSILHGFSRLTEEEVLLLTQSLDRIAQRAELQTVIHSFTVELGNSSLIELLGTNHSDSLGNELGKRIEELIHSEEGLLLVETFAIFLLDSLENEKRTLFELLNEDIGKQLRKFFQEFFPPLIQKIAAWLLERRYEIERLIDETFEKNVDSKLKSWVIKTFIGSISQSAQLVPKVLEYLDTYRKNPEGLSLQLTERILSYLNEQSIGAIIQQIGGKNYGPQLSQMLHSYLKKWISNRDASAITGYFDRKISEILPIHELEPYLNRTLQEWLKVKVPSYFKEGNELPNMWTQPLSQWVNAQKEAPLRSVLSYEALESLSKKLRKQLLPILVKEEEQFRPKLIKYLGTQLEEKRWSSLVGEKEWITWSMSLKELFQTYLKKEYAQISQKPLVSFIHTLNSLPNIHSGISKGLQSVLLQHMDGLMKGRIEEIVKANLTMQSPNQIRDMVENFMGKELKPITLLGALWGGLTGGLLPLIPLPTSGYAPIVAAGGLYGFTGYFTNWIALKMIFRPYYAKKIPGTSLTLPFTPGVAVKNQNRFAGNMGNFVSQKLMNPEGIVSTFQQKRVGMEELWMQEWSANSYEKIHLLLKEQAVPLSERIHTFSMEVLKNNKDRVFRQIELLVHSAGNTRWDLLNTSSIEDFIWEFLHKDTALIWMQEELHEALSQEKKKNLPLGARFPEASQTAVFESLALTSQQRIEKFFKETSTFDQRKPYYEQLRGSFEKTLDTSIGQLLGEGVRKRLSDKAGTYIHSQVQNSELRKKFVSLLMDALQKEISPEKKIKEVFSGGLLDFIGKNAENILQRIIQSGADWLRKNASEMADRIYEKAFEEQKAALLYKDSIRKTVKQLAEEGLPAYLLHEQTAIFTLVQEEIERVGNVPLENLRLGLREENVILMVDDLLKSEGSLNLLKNLSSKLLESIYEIPTRSFLYLGGVSSFEHFSAVLDPMIGKIHVQLRKSLFSGGVEFQQDLQSLIESLSPGLLKRTTLVELLPEEEALFEKSWMRDRMEMLLYSATCKQQLHLILQEIKAEIEKKPLSELLHLPTFSQDLIKVLNSLLENEEVLNVWKVPIERTFARLIHAAPADIKDPTKEFILKLGMNTALNSLQDSLPALLGSIEIRKIVVQEIEKMEPTEIENLFQSFASKYFNRLVQYGFGFGVVFGLAIDVLLQLAVGWKKE